MSEQLVNILVTSNPEDPYSCTLCCERFSGANYVLKFSACSHIICKTCHGIYPQNICNHCKKGGSYVKNDQLTTLATSGADLKRLQEKSQQNININIVTNRGTTISCVVNRNMTFKDFAKKMDDEKGMVIQSFNFKNKVFKPDQHGAMSLSAMDIGDNAKIICVATFRGGINPPGLI